MIGLSVNVKRCCKGSIGYGPYNVTLRASCTLFCVFIYRLCITFLITVIRLVNYDFRKKTILKLRGFSPQANYTDRATSACR
jgi:hypothetical protein